MARIIESLREEHANMAKLLDALERQLAIFDAAGQPDYDVMQGVVDYCLAYPDLYHHPKENLILARLKRRDPDAAEAVGNLNGEHAEIGRLTRHFKDALDNVLQEAEMPRSNFDHVARSFLAYYRAHIEMEEDLFYPAAERALTPADWGDLDKRMTSGADPLFGGAPQERFAYLRDHILEWDESDRAEQRMS